MKKLTLSVFACMLAIGKGFSFCGFYVAKADATIFNKTSQIILVRDGNRTTITMSNDFQGNVEDFAMVVPVPTILKKEDIRVAEHSLFTKLDTYSGPRLVEYYDENPCERRITMDYAISENSLDMAPMMNYSSARIAEKDYNVTIEAEYQIEEYDVLILSAKESDGLKRWLTDNGYKIPAKAEEVLDPYIKDGLKFFVVKVNTEALKKSGVQKIRPLQISFNSPKFVLPIRLGMANSRGEQDMIVYAFTKTGRVEATNYRTVKMPTNRNIPLFCKTRFGKFYKDVFKHQYRHKSRKAVFLEYAWNVSPQQRGAKCDPCVGPPPIHADFAQAGVTWAGRENVFFTRLHVRYTRSKFPQDLQFQVTPNKEHFQVRYILTNPATGSFDCDAGQDYLIDLVKLREKELAELSYLAQWDVNKYSYYVNDYRAMIEDEDERNMAPIVPGVPPVDGFYKKLMFSGSLLLLLLGFVTGTFTKISRKLTA